MNSDLLITAEGRWSESSFRCKRLLTALSHSMRLTPGIDIWYRPKGNLSDTSFIQTRTAYGTMPLPNLSDERSHVNQNGYKSRNALTKQLQPRSISTMSEGSVAEGYSTPYVRKPSGIWIAVLLNYTHLLRIISCDWCICCIGIRESSLVCILLLDDTMAWIANITRST